MALSDGSRVFLVTSRTRDPFKPFTVALYCVTPDHNCYAAYLGNREPFWWRASLTLRDQPRRIEVAASGEVVATYWLDSNTFDVPMNKKFSYSAVKFDGVRHKILVPETVPEIVARAIFPNGAPPRN